MKPYLLEILCFVGNYMGTKNKFFNQLLDKKPWLMNEDEPDFDPDRKKRMRVPAFAETYYDVDAYENMVICLGKILIQNHEHIKFKGFFYS